MTVVAVEQFTPYSTALGMYDKPPTWMDEYDAQRIAAYQVYEQIYWNVPETFKLVLRGENALPIYIPTARTIVDTTNRYLCPDPGFVMDESAGSTSEQEATRAFLSNLFRREKWWSKFNANKRYGVMRGDWVFHLLANPAKPAGRRIKIETIDPASYFPVTHPDDPDKIIAVHLIEQFIPEGETDVVIKRQTYQRGFDPVANDGSDTTILNSVGLFSLEHWQSLDDSAIKTLKPPTPLPPQIQSIPVYALKNIETPGDPFGSSELRVFERILAAINQAISDEELSLALEGLGVYATDGGPPRNAQGLPTDWVLGPGRVVEHTPGSDFKRVNGISSVEPNQAHLAFLINALKEASATSDAAIGKVDVSVAESGISLLLQLGPMLSKVAEREDTIDDVIFQFYHDLCQMWLPAYEAITTPCIALPVYGSAIPDNRERRFDEVMKMFDAQLVDAAWVMKELGKIGYEFSSDTAQAAISEASARAVASDPFSGRLDADLEATDSAGSTV